MNPRKDLKPLNKLEVWVADHAAPIFGVIALLIVLGAGGVFYTFQQQSGIESTVHVLEPQITRINRTICDRASLGSPARARRCAERIRVGLINCRHVQACQAAFLALATFPPAHPPRNAHPLQPSSEPTGEAEGGDAFQPSSHGHQPSGPGSPGHHTPAPTQPSPAPSPPAPEAPGNSGEAPGHTGENPGQGGGEPPGQSEGNHGQSSGVGAEVCLLETCAGVKVGLG